MIYTMESKNMNKDWVVEETIVKLYAPITLWEFQIPETTEYSRVQLHCDIEEIIRKTGDKQGRNTNVKALMTNWVMYEHAPFKIVCDTVEDIIQTFYKERSNLELQTFMTTCWGAIYEKGDYSELHHHIPALYSWVYYVNVEEGASPLHFPWFPGHTYHPKSGYGIIFPGWLTHEVPPTDSERIIVVGNVEGTGSVTYPQRDFLRIK